MLHEGREIEITKDVLCAAVHRLGNLVRLIRIARYFPHFVGEYMMVAVRGNRPIKTGKYLRGISGHEPTKVL